MASIMEWFVQMFTSCAKSLLATIEIGQFQNKSPAIRDRIWVVYWMEETKKQESVTTNPSNLTSDLSTERVNDRLSKLEDVSGRNCVLYSSEITRMLSEVHFLSMPSTDISTEADECPIAACNSLDLTDEIWLIIFKCLDMRSVRGCTQGNKR